jgi:hypothetical protein
VAGDDRQRGHVYFLGPFFRKSNWQRPWEFTRKASTMRCEDKTVDWVESDSWLMRIVDKLLARNS